MDPNQYGENYQAHLLEQYKMFVEMADRVSARRGQANTFYISLLSALLALLSLIIDKDLFTGPSSILLFFTSIVGLALCLGWYVNIQSYKQLNGLKFEVINEMELSLPFPCYKREWDIREEKIRNKEAGYTLLTTVEKFVPSFFAGLYGLLLVYSLLAFVGVISPAPPAS